VQGLVRVVSGSYFLSSAVEAVDIEVAERSGMEEALEAAMAAAFPGVVAETGAEEEVRAGVGDL
jgi:hypothetical protein